MSYFPEEPVRHLKPYNYRMFGPGLNPMIPQDMYVGPEAAGPRFLSTDGYVRAVAPRAGTSGFFGDLTPTRPDIAGIPTATLLVVGVIAVGIVLAFTLGGAGEEPRRGF